MSLDRKVVDIEVLHLDEKGYGPNGEMTRRDWRALCLAKLNGSVADWTNWLNTLKPHTAPYLPASFAYCLINDIGESNGFEATANPYALPSVTLDFVGVEFTDSARFYRNFEIAALFCAARFKGHLDVLRDITFRYVNFRHAVFEKGANFSKLTFKNDANFIGVKFSELANFDGSTFDGKSWFNESQFNGDATFGGTDFKHNAVFLNCEFDKVAGFGGAKFRVNCIFEKTKFANETWFEGATFARGAHFEDATFGIAPTFLSVVQ